MEKDNVVVAIELGSSKISGAAASRNQEGGMEILAYATLPSSAFIRQGSVYNLDRTAEGLAMLVELLERQLGSKKIIQVFTGYSGKSLRSAPVVVERDLAEGEVVTSTLIDGMLAECGETPSGNMLSLSVVSQEFTTDGKTSVETDPVGVACSHLTGRFQRILIRPRLFKLLDDCFKHASLDLADSFVQPLSLANLVLTADERQRGCCLLDYGADTTTVQVYKGGQMCFLRVIPLGSDTITRDIMNVFRISHDEAEMLKKTYGLFGLSGSNEESVEVAGNKISLKLLGEVVAARNEEIMANVIHQLKSSDYYNSLFGGLVITGGGSNLKKLQVALSSIFAGINPVRIAHDIPSDFKWCDPDADVTDGTRLGLLALLSQSTDNCCISLPEKDMYSEPDPVKEATMVMGSLFDENGESMQDTIDRKEKERLKEEQEKIEAAKEAAKNEVKKKKKTSLIHGIRESFHKFFEDVQ